MKTADLQKFNINTYIDIDKALPQLQITTPITTDYYL